MKNALTVKNAPAAVPATTATASAPATGADRMSALSAYVAANNVRMFQFLRFNGKSGQLLTRNADGEDEQMEFNGDMALNLAEMTHGHTYWLEDKPFKDDMHSFLDNPVLPPIGSLPIPAGAQGRKPGPKDGWRANMALPLKDLATGREYIMQLSAAGALTSFKNLFAVIRQDAIQHDIDVEAPVITINAGSFFSKRAGEKVHKPIFKLDRWEDKASVAFTVKAADYARKEDEGADA